VESLNGGKYASALDSSPIATPKLVASSGVAQGDSNGKGASHFCGTHTSKLKFHCTFCKNDGHTVEFAFSVSSMSDVCVSKLLRSHVAFLMARVILIVGGIRNQAFHTLNREIISVSKV
jgi:hypothetical protein